MRNRQTRARVREIRWLFAVLLLAFALLCTVPACTNFSRYSSRKDFLQQDLKRFHMALFTPDIPILLRMLPLEERAEWADPLVCYFGRYRVVDYKVQQIKTGPKVEDARVLVWVTVHPVDSMTIQEKVWDQEWEYRDKRWFLDSESETTRKFFGDCLPPEDEQKEPLEP
jgi:hypothetical protein